MVKRSTLVGTTISHSRFERVIFHECDFSGTTFVNCLFRDCLFVGVKSRSYLAMDSSILDGLTIARSQLDRFELLGCQLRVFDCVEVGMAKLIFHHSTSHKKTGRVSLSNCDLAIIGGLDTLKEAGVRVLVDAALWRELGDHLLRERGVEEQVQESVLSANSVERIVHDLSSRTS